MNLDVKAELVGWLSVQKGGIRLLDEDWTSVQVGASLGIGPGSPGWGSQANEMSLGSGEAIADDAVPRLSALHIAANANHADLVRSLCQTMGVDTQDQYGFSALHYAVIGKFKALCEVLLGFGASAILESNRGTTPLDLARKLNNPDIISILEDAAKIHSEPSVSRLKQWLTYLGAREYFAGFIKAGYDLDFIATEGVSDQDLDCVGIPLSKLGIRRKLLSKHKISEYLEDLDEEEEDEEEDEEVDD